MADAKLVPVKLGNPKYVAAHYICRDFAPNTCRNGSLPRCSIAAIDAIGVVMTLSPWSGTMPYGRIVIQLLTKRIARLFEKCGASVVALCFDTVDYVPLAKGAEQAHRDASHGGADVSIVAPNLDLNSPVPENWNKGMLTSREVYRKTVVKWICACMIKRLVQLPMVGEQVLWIVGGYNEEGEVSETSVLFADRDRTIVTSSVPDGWVGEGEMQVFYFLTKMKRARTQKFKEDNSASYLIQVNDTDALFLGLVWIEKMTKAGYSVPTLWWNYHAEGEKFDCIDITALYVKLISALSWTEWPARVLAQVYLLSGGDYNDGFFNLTHKTSLVAVLYQKSFSRFFAGPKSTLSDVAAFEATVRAALSQAPRQLAIREDTIPVPFTAVCEVRYLNLCYSLCYYDQVGRGSIKLPVPTKEHGYALRDETLPAARDNIIRMNNSLQD